MRSRSCSIPNVLKLAATLRFFSEGITQKEIGQELLIGMSQSGISVILNEMITILGTKVVHKWISQPDRQKESKLKSMQESMKYFFEKFQLPGVIGCVDGTHIKITPPVQNKHRYLNRRGFHSMNPMIVSTLIKDKFSICCNILFVSVYVGL